MRAVLGSVRHHAESGVRVFVCALVSAIHVKYLNRGGIFFPLDGTNIRCYAHAEIWTCLREGKRY